MRAMVFHRPGDPLQLTEVPRPRPAEQQVLLKVEACGLCRTDLHIIDGELDSPAVPLIPGHQIVGRVVSSGTGVETLHPGTRVGVPWLGWTCGACPRCLAKQENLCPNARFTGYSQDGGFAEYCVADERFCFPIPEEYSSLQAAPLLCAGLIGYRSLNMAGPGLHLGFYGFGASAHILIQIARFQGRFIYTFTRPGDSEGQAFARKLGAIWAGDSSSAPPRPLDAALIFAPAGELVPQALRAVAPGGTVVCAGIHMSDIPSFPYSILWEERVLRSVANLTRHDGREFFALAPKVPVRTEVTPFALEHANRALQELREGHIHGAAVLVLDD